MPPLCLTLTNGSQKKIRTPRRAFSERTIQPEYDIRVNIFNVVCLTFPGQRKKRPSEVVIDTRCERDDSRLFPLAQQKPKKK